MPSLLEIPIELIELIASFLAPTDLFNVRTTCRDMVAATSDVFGRTYFADRTFLLACPHSMEIIENISSNNHLSKFLKKLRFSAATLRPHKNLQSLRCASPPVIGPSLPRQEERRVRKEYAEAYKGLMEDQWDFWGQGQYDSLVVVFRSLRAAGSTPDVLCPGFGFEYDDPNGSRPTGFQRLENIAGHHLPLCYEHHSGPMIGYIYEAILETEFPIRHLELATDAPGIPMRRLLCPRACDHFKHLHTLRLYVDPEPDEESEEALNATKELIGILFNAVNLRQLTLGIYGAATGGHAALFAMMAHASSIEVDGRQSAPLLFKLTDLELVGHHIPYKDMYAFVSRRATTLQRISMKRSKYDDWIYRNKHPKQLLGLTEASFHN